METVWYVRDPDLADLLRLTAEEAGHDVIRLASLDGVLAHECGDALVIQLGSDDCVPIVESLRAGTAAPIVIISARSRLVDEVSALEAGADLFVREPFSPMWLADEIERLVGLSAEDLISRRKRFLERSRRLSARVASIHQARRMEVGFDALTPTERRVAALVSDGLDVESASASLGIAPSTFLSHKGAIRRKLAVRRGESLRDFLRASTSA